MNDVIGNAKKLHFVGIGGIGMSSLAQYMFSQGYTITGSDIAENNYVKKLKEMGIKIYKGHSIENIDSDVDVVVVSSAIKDDNAEVMHAKRLNIPVIKRYQLLAYVVNSKKSIAIAGSHGKTTTTSLCASLLKSAGIDITAIIGGKSRNINNNVIIGNSDYFIIEADESDGGFLLLDPYIGVVTNIDNDHLGFYGNFENEKLAFKDFIENSKTRIVNIDDPIIRHERPKDAITYSITRKADIYAYNITTTPSESIFDVKTPKREIEKLKLGIIGIHNVSNSLAVIAIADLLDIDTETIREVFSGFKGVDRRFTFVGMFKKCRVYDDYAHHPAEIKATISAARLISNNVYAIFQPHRFSRTSYLMDEFAKSFKNVKRVFVLDIYSAQEKPIDGIDSEILSEKINQVSGNSIYVSSRESLKKLLDQIDTEGVIVGLGAGSISTIVRELVDDNKKDSAQ